MFSPIEQILLILILLATIYAGVRATQRLAAIVRRGQGQIDWSLARKRLLEVLAVKLVALAPTWKTRRLASLFHAFVVWGFLYYLLINVFDLLTRFIPGFHIPGRAGDLYRLGADLLSVAILISMVYFVLRRWVLRPQELTARAEVLLHPQARRGIARDSLVVAGLVMTHVGMRFLGESFDIAQNGRDAWQPLASGLAGLWNGWAGAEAAWHVTAWLGLLSLLVFIPYFPYSKHVHLIFTPLNFLLKPQRRSLAEQGKIDFDDQSLVTFGAASLQDLGWEQIMDAYACIMCYRCQDACPPYQTGKLLSPAALEINKRYFLNQDGSRFARGEVDTAALVEFAIPEEAVWACTACGACVDICPVGNEPMRDILDIRRGLTLMENRFPKSFQLVFRNLERQANPWGIGAGERLAWAENLDVPTVDQNPGADLLWWVGCAATADTRAQSISRALATILKKAEVNFAVLGEMESCTGDAARRAGKEDLFFELAQANVETLNAVNPKRIVASCPHCYHTLKNEYPAFGGHYQVNHHSQLIAELMQGGRLALNPSSGDTNPVAFHDPCYLGRANGEYDSPRLALQSSGARLVELARRREQAFCCGAGGAQMWKEEEHGRELVRENRFNEVQASGAGILAVGCPFCKIMLSDQAVQAGNKIATLDLAEIVAKRLA